MKIGDLFIRDIRRKIRPVVEVEDRDESELRDEINEYVVTDQIALMYVRLLENSYFDRSPNGVSLWISGFFGTGKSLFLKLFALALAHARIGETSVIDCLVDSADDADFRRALRALKGRKPAKIIALHMRSDALEHESIVSILWRRLHQEFGYSRIPWIAEIERSLSRRGLLDAFASAVQRAQGRPWSEIRLEPILQNVVLARGLLAVDPANYPNQAAAERAIQDAREQEHDLLTVARFTSRCLELLSEHPEYERLFFALDEMGQFAANNPDLLLELAALVEKFLSEGRGRLWLAATAQERLDQVIDNFAQRRDDVNKIRDRFVKGLRVELTSENAELIVLDRLLKKPSERTEVLRSVLEPNRAWIEHETVLPDANAELRPSKLDDVLASYPFVPSHFGLITRFMQGLAHDVGGTADRTAKGARALIGVTQEIVTDLADRELGALASLDRLYAAMEGSIPSEDVAVVHALDSEHRRPPFSSEVLRADYILDQIGDRHVLSTQANLVRSILAEAGAPIGEIQDRTEEALQYLTEHAYVRETGGSGKTTYRFLRAYQRKIEDDVRNFHVDTRKLIVQSETLLKDVLESLGVIGTKITYRSTRSFQLVAAIDGQFVTADGRLKIDVWSPLIREAADAQADSVKNHSVIWVCGDWDSFEDEVRTVVATSAVLTARREKATTQLENEQIRRAQADLEFRETHLREKAEGALLHGHVYVYGAPLPVTKDIASAIIEAIVDADYRGLADAPFPVAEADLSAIFAPVPPKDGAAVKLGLVDGAAFSDRSGITANFLSVVDELHFRGGAPGKALIDRMGESPRGYAEMQTMLTACVLWRMGKVRVFSAVGIDLPRDASGERRMSRISEFRALSFERERTVDDAKLKAAQTLLQRFDRSGPLELPSVASRARSLANDFRGQIELVLGLVREDVPQVGNYVAPLRESAKLVLNAKDDVGTVETLVANADTIREAKMILEPLGKLDAQAVADIVASRRLIESYALSQEQPEIATHLRGLLDGPKPWVDLGPIRQDRSQIVESVRVRLRAAHDGREAAVLRAEAELRSAAQERSLGADALASALQALDPCRCKSFDPRDDGTCATCKKSIDALQDQILALPGYLENAYQKLLSPRQEPADSRDGAGRKGDSKLPSSVAAPSIVSVRRSVRLPQLLDSPERVESFVLELRTALLDGLERFGSIEVGP